MEKTLALLGLLLLAAPSARAAGQPASKDAAAAASAAPAPDVIVPLNVRDPSALIMGPGAQPVNLSIVPPPRAPAAEGPAKPGKIVVDKTGVQAGKRAVAVPMDEDQLLAVKPGDHVDVLAVFETVTSAGMKETFAATMLQNVRVLGVATTKDLRGKGVLTLELNPLEAGYALLGARQADLGLSVRAPGDVELYPFELTSFRRFFH